MRCAHHNPRSEAACGGAGPRLANAAVVGVGWGATPEYGGKGTGDGEDAVEQNEENGEAYDGKHGIDGFAFSLDLLRSEIPWREFIEGSVFLLRGYLFAFSPCASRAEYSNAPYGAPSPSRVRLVSTSLSILDTAFGARGRV